MSISTSLAVQPPAAQGVSRTELDFRSPLLSEHTKFESAIASAQRQSQSEVQVASAQEQSQSEPDAVPDEESPPASQHIPDRRKDKFKPNIAPIPAQGTCSNVYPGAPTISPATTRVAVVKESGDTASALSATPAVSTAPAVFSGTLSSMPGVATAAYADTSAVTSETVMEAQDPAGADMGRMPKPSPLKEVLSRNAAGDATQDASAAFVGQTHAVSEAESGSALPTDEWVDLPQSDHLMGASPTTQVRDISQTSANSPPLQSGDLQTLADAFETSVRYFERGGDKWIGSAYFTLESSVLKGATFQIISDGKSLSILLSEFSAAPVLISRQQEAELGATLARKLGRSVNLNLIASEIESVESADASEYAEQQ